MELKKIGGRIQEQRKKKGWTQQKFAEKLGLSPNYVSAVERGVYMMSYESLIEAMNILGCSADEIFCDLVDKSTVTRANKIYERIEDLPIAEKNKILDTLEILVKK